MAFKVKPPYPTFTTPIYHKDMDDNTLGLANNNGTILVNENASPAREKDIVKHEMVHIDQMKRGDLDYDDKNVYWKGKIYPRSEMKEGAKNLPWEMEAYNKK
tara:strand:- start:2029 stop:2334 length:306 start_codon:yes stop_codon:yes gene_type:complete